MQSSWIYRRAICFYGGRMESFLEDGYWWATIFVAAILVIILNFSMLWQATMIPNGDDVLFR